MKNKVGLVYWVRFIHVHFQLPYIMFICCIYVKLAGIYCNWTSAYLMERNFFYQNIKLNRSETKGMAASETVISQSLDNWISFDCDQLDNRFNGSRQMGLLPW